jgi:adenylate kinase family enzyme
VRRVAVIGSSSCAGKTTFARLLAARLGVPHIEQDALFWGPDWAPSPKGDFRARVVAALEADAWVVDGNYGSLGGVQWDRADTLVWLDIPLHVALWRIFRRTLGRVRSREELWGGNRETIRNAFFSKDSLLIYAVRTYRRRRRRWDKLLGSERWAHLRVHRFRSNADADRWLASI